MTVQISEAKHKQRQRKGQNIMNEQSRVKREILRRITVKIKQQTNNNNEQTINKQETRINKQ